MCPYHNPKVRIYLMPLHGPTFDPFTPQFLSPLPLVTQSALSISSLGRRAVSFSSRKCGARRAMFIFAAVEDLAHHLERMGIRLWLFYGRAEEVSIP